jgi:O-antigen/teichoic acid export membrane protein
MDHSSSLSSRTFWNATGSLVAALGRIVSAVVIARQLGPEVAGKYAFLAVLAEFLTQIVSCGLPSTLTRYLAEASGKDNREGRAGLLRWVTRRYAVLAAIGSTAAFIGLSGYALTTNLLLSLFLLSLTTYTLVHAYLSGIQDFRLLAKVNFLSGLALVVSQPIGVALFGLNGALAGGIISSLMSIIALRPIAASVFRRKAPPKDMPDPAELKRYAIYTWLAALVSAVVWTRAEVFFLNRLSTHAEVGFYNVSLTLYSGILMAGSLLAGAMMPHFSALVGSQNKDVLQRDYCRLVSFVALFTFPLSIGGAAVMPELLPLIYGEQYLPAIPAATVLMISGVLSVAGVGSSITYAFGKSNYIFSVALLCAPLMIVGCLACIPGYGSLGGAWVRFGVQAVSVVMGTAIVHVLLKIVPPYRSLASIALAALLCAAVARLVIFQFPKDALVLAAGIGAGALTYLFALRLLRPIPAVDRVAYMTLASRLPGGTSQYAVPFMRWLLAVPR